MNAIRKNISVLFILLLAVFVGAAAGLYFDLPSKFRKPPPMTGTKQVYACPMHADVMQDHPGNCPKCGMALVRADQAKAGHDQCGDNGEDHPGCCVGESEPEAASELKLPPGHPTLKLPPGHPPIQSSPFTARPNQPTATAAQTNSPH